MLPVTRWSLWTSALVVALAGGCAGPEQASCGCPSDRPVCLEGASENGAVVTCTLRCDDTAACDAAFGPGSCCVTAGTSAGLCLPAESCCEPCGDECCGPGARCDQERCVPTGPRCGATTCPAGYVCADGGCCPADRPHRCGGGCCVDEASCVADRGVCLPAGATPCPDGSWCPAGQTCTRGGGCHPIGGEDCGQGRTCGAGQRCTARGCCPGASSQQCGDVCCPGWFECVGGGEACLPPGADYCGSGRWCPPGKACGQNGACASSRSTPCGRRRCAPGEVCAEPGLCCPPASPVPCAGTCCPLGHSCDPDTHACVPVGATECGMQTCPPGTSCSPSCATDPASCDCLPVGAAACGASFCAPGYVCAEGTCCPSSQPVRCGRTCCPTGFGCSPRGECVSPGGSVCEDGSWCPADTGCGGGGGCVPNGAADCGGGRYCDPGYVCAEGGCCPGTKPVGCGSQCCIVGSTCAPNGECILPGGEWCEDQGIVCGPGTVCKRNGVGCRPRAAKECGLDGSYCLTGACTGEVCPAGRCCPHDAPVACASGGCCPEGSICAPARGGCIVPEAQGPPTRLHPAIRSGVFDATQDGDNWITSGAEVLVIDAVQIFDGGEGTDCPHGPWGNIHYDLFQPHVWPGWQVGIPDGVNASGLKIPTPDRILRGPHFGWFGCHCQICWFFGLGLCTCTPGVGPPQGEWLSDEMLRYQNAGIYRWRPGEDAVVLRFWESDGKLGAVTDVLDLFSGCDGDCDDGCCGRRHDIVGVGLVRKADTLGGCGAWFELESYTGDHPRRPRGRIGVRVKLRTTTLPESLTP